MQEQAVDVGLLLRGGGAGRVDVPEVLEGFGEGVADLAGDAFVGFVGHAARVLAGGWGVFGLDLAYLISSTPCTACTACTVLEVWW